MALINNVYFYGDNGGTAVAWHGVTGVVQRSMGVVERFRRPSASAAGYLVNGSDVKPSSVDVWKAFVTSAEAQDQIARMNSLVPSPTRRSICAYYANYTSSDPKINVVVTSVEVLTFKAVRGSIITGSTAARFVVEARIGLEYLP